MATLRSLWAWFAISLLIMLWVPLLAVIRLFDRDPVRYKTGRWFRHLGLLLTRVNPMWRVRVSGAFPEDPRNPYVVVSNHLSQADIPVMSYLPWEMKWVAKAEVMDIPFLGRMLHLAGDIPVDRKDRRSGAQALIKARDYLSKRCSVMFFPEGTRSLDGRMLAFNDGAFRLAIKAGVPILPIAIEGTQNALPKHSWRFGDARDIRVKVLPPIDTTGLKAADTAALRDQVRRLIMAELAAWRGVPIEAVDALATPDGKDSAKTTVTAG